MISLSRMSVRAKLFLLPCVSIVAMLILSAIFLAESRTQMMDDQKAKVRAVVAQARSIVNDLEVRAERREFPSEQAQATARNALRAVRYEGNEYVFVFADNGDVILNGAKPELEGKSQWDAKTPAGQYFVRDLVARAQEGGGFVEYLWPKDGAPQPMPKVSYAEKSKAWGWVIGSGVYIDNVDALFWASAVQGSLMALAFAVITFAIAYLIGRGITSSLTRVGGLAKAVSEGDLTAVAEVTTRDEIGELVGHINQMVERLRGVVTEISTAVANVSAGSQELSASAEQLSQGATEQASAAEEASSSMEEMASNVKQNAENAGQTEK
ncbi:methyl-accepting chemotaxis protein, partial [Azospirillum sp. TSO22-1]|uniref:cache domain-containing protein n=1 Tax=Azospirillum sp. TSO22-1 TaxID=716789 RepID=UPI000D619A4C